jgi:tRNA (mo5U34)-methyltransferase
MIERTEEEARKFLDAADFVWHQRIELAPGVFSPGVNEINLMLEHSSLPPVSGKSVLDIGTCNGGVLFELERRGASRLVGVDIYDQEWFGFAALRAFLDSKAEYLQASVYELDAVLGERFDIVLFLGVLYHLRHPLLALDALRAVTKQYAVLETEICDGKIAALAQEPVTLFYRGNQLNADHSNWFVPSRRTLVDWCESCGFSVAHVLDTGAGNRALVGMTPTAGYPEYYENTYERPLKVVAQQKFGRSAASA